MYRDIRSVFGHAFTTLLVRAGLKIITQMNTLMLHTAIITAYMFRINGCIYISYRLKLDQLEKQTKMHETLQRYNTWHFNFLVCFPNCNRHYVGGSYLKIWKLNHLPKLKSANCFIDSHFPNCLVLLQYFKSLICLATFGLLSFCAKILKTEKTSTWKWKDLMRSEISQQWLVWKIPLHIDYKLK